MRLLLSMLALISVTGHSVSQEVPEQKSIVDKMKAAWASYREKLDQHFSKGWNIEQANDSSLTWTNPARANLNRKPTPGVGRFLNNGNGYVSIEEGKEVVHGGNPLYTFLLVKSSRAQPGEENKLHLRKFHLTKDKKPEYQSFIMQGATLFDQAKRDSFGFPLHLSGQPLEFYFDHPQFQITKITEFSTDGKRLTKMEVACPHDPLEKPLNPLQRGEFVFQNDEFWLPQSYFFHSQAGDRRPSTADWKLTYYDGALPLIKGYEYQSESKDEKLGYAMTGKATFSYLSGGENFPANRFTLSYHGLPEPNGITWPAPTLVYPWIFAVLGMGGLLLLVFFLRRARLTKAARLAST